MQIRRAWGIEDKVTCQRFCSAHRRFSYKEPVYHMKDPFVPPDIHKKDYQAEDFLVVGANCAICQRPVCIDEVRFARQFAPLTVVNFRSAVHFTDKPTACLAPIASAICSLRDCYWYVKVSSTTYNLKYLKTATKKRSD